MACECCSMFEPLISTYSVRVTIDALKGTLDVAHYDESWRCESVDISHCPMCGRDLRDDAS